jgi:hypothetical protein
MFSRTGAVLVTLSITGGALAQTTFADVLVARQAAERAEAAQLCGARLATRRGAPW